MYDVSSPASLYSLQKWWTEFRERAPVRDGEEEDFCCVVVGNKIDVSGSKNGVAMGAANGNGDSKGVSGDQGNGEGKMKSTLTASESAKGKWQVSEEEARSFLEKSIPRSTVPATPDGCNSDTSRRLHNAGPGGDDERNRPLPVRDEEPPSPASPLSPSFPRTRSKSISITINDKTLAARRLSPHPQYPTRGLSPSQPRSRSAVRLSSGYGTGPGISSGAGHGGAQSSLGTRESIYHTPSSSYFDVYESARTSPVPFPGHGTSPPDEFASGSAGRGSLGKMAGMRKRNGRKDSTASRTSASSVSSTSALTITQSLFARSTAKAVTTPTAPSPPPLPQPEFGPKLFFTSAKTGEGVSEVFEYVARRVVVRWEWEARQWHEEGEWEGDDTIRVGLGRDGARTGEHDGWGMKVARRCCAS